MTPWPHQRDGLTALHEYICRNTGNPCVVIPTGGGKSAMMAWAIEHWRNTCPWFRCIILAHRKELVAQNSSELRKLYPSGDIGVFSAALKSRDTEANILYAGIDSVYKRAGEFPPWDVIMVDEAHRIPMKGYGKYRRFIKESKRWNDKLRVVGWTATPYRLDGGQICHADHILNEICYEAKVTDLIAGGYLCPLRSKVAVSQPSMEGVKKAGGDYTLKSLAGATNKQALIEAAVEEAVDIINREDRNAIIFFCVDIEHAGMVSLALGRKGIVSPVVTSKTDQYTRDCITADFKNGHLRAVCNVQIFTEGFDAKQIDCVVLLRPTLSAGLYYQMVGRGLRKCKTKQDCLILDFSHCIDTHGPIDLLGGRPIVLATCHKCRECFSRALGECPHCGWKIPKKEMEKLEDQERERRMHADRASTRAILSGQPEVLEVHDVFVSRHCRPGKQDALRVTYRCAGRTINELIYLNGKDKGYKDEEYLKAQKWFAERVNIKECTVNKALYFLLTKSAIKDYTKTITVKLDGKHWTVVGYNEDL